MQRLDLIRGIRRLSTVIAAVSVYLIGWTALAEQETDAAKSNIPLIVMDDVPLADAIKNLARQAGINYIFDPRLSADFNGADGELARESHVTVRWENVTAKGGLTRLLEERGIRLVEDPDSKISRFTRSKAAPRASGLELEAGARKVAVNETNVVVPLIVMDEVPLEVAIQLLARQAKLKVDFEPGLSAASGHRGPGALTVSVRWENISPRQALAMLLINYNLVAVRNSEGGETGFTIKPFVDAKAEAPGAGHTRENN
jgi:hypothetical protein